MKPKVLFLDDSPERHKQADRLWSNHTVVHCWTLDDFIDAFNDPQHQTFDAVSLDHDINDFTSKNTWQGCEATGLDACGVLIHNKSLRCKLPQTILIHSINSPGSIAMKKFLQNHGFNVLWIPWSEPIQDE